MARSTLITGALPGLADWSFGQAQTKPRWELRGFGRHDAYSSGFPSTQQGRFVMAPLLRTKPGARTEIAGNNQRLAAIGEPIPEGFIHENPLSHQPIGFSLPDRPKDCGLAREILQLIGVPCI